MRQYEVKNKKSKMKCFNCGELLAMYEYYFKSGNSIYCEECGVNILQGEEEMYREEVYMKEWRKQHPNESFDQWQIDQANLRKYGEY